MQQSLIVLHVLVIHMVYVDIQRVVVILAVKHMIMVFTAQLVTTAQAVVVQLIMPLDTMVLGAQPHIIVVMGAGIVLHRTRRLALI